MSTVLLKSIDFETSSKADDAEVIEAGVTDLWFDTETKVATLGAPRSWLYRPQRGITPEAMAVHHITLDMVEGKPVFDADEAMALVMDQPDFLAAHNAGFEQAFMPPEIIGERRWICTFKSALRAYEDFPEHNLGALRYRLDLPVDQGLAMPPHRAGPDSYVSGGLLARLLATETVNDMVRWTKEPRHYPRCPFRPHMGKPWSDVPYKFLTWMLSKDDMEFDVRFAARAEINRRDEIGESR